MKTIRLKYPYVAVMKDGKLSYGGNQSWFQGKILKKYLFSSYFRLPLKFFAFLSYVIILTPLSSAEHYFFNTKPEENQDFFTLRQSF